MSRTLHGIYNRPDRMETLDAMERWLGRRHTVHVAFTSWHEGAIEECFDRLLPQIWEAGRIPLLTWEPFTAGDATPDLPTRIAAGEFDDYLDSWAGRLEVWLAGPDEKFGTADDRRLYLRFAHEMNGDWYPWSPTGTGGASTDYIGMWRHVHDRIATGIPSECLQWVWCVNHADVGEHTAEECYPGDEFVDWVGVDGFNWGASREWSSWQSPETVFGGMTDRLERFTKPLCVPEVACSSVTEAGHDPQRKAAWVSEALAYLDDHVSLWCWFNEDKETDWAVFGGERGTVHPDDDATSYHRYSAYRDAMARFDGAQPSGPRLVDDATFSGE